MNDKARKALSVLGDIAIFIIIIFSVAVTVMAFSSRDSGVPKLFGYSFLSVQSDSMSGVFEKGDLIIDMDCNPETLKKGDVVTFWKYSPDNKSRFLNTHRIIEKKETRFEIYNQTVITYVTRGDNNKESDVDELSPDYIVGLWTGKKISNLGMVLDFLSSPKGFLVCIVVPLALLFAFQLYKFIITLIESKKERALEEIASKTEEEKDRVIAEYLAQQQKLQNADSQPQTVPAQEETGQEKTGTSFEDNGG